jgi:hypothetical protein
MSYDNASQPKFQVNRQQIIAGAICMGVGGAIAVAGMAMAGTALAIAFRQRVQQMDVPPSELARQHWSAVKNATTSGVNVWLKENPATGRQAVTQR